MEFIKKLFDLGASATEEDWGDTELVFIVLPEALEPDRRYSKYERFLDAALRILKLGYVSGGGSNLSAPRQDGSRDIDWVGVDVDTINVDNCRALLREHLPELGCLPGTVLQYDSYDDMFQDEYDGREWHLARPRRPFDSE